MTELSYFQFDLNAAAEEETEGLSWRVCRKHANKFLTQLLQRVSVWSAVAWSLGQLKVNVFISFSHLFSTFLCAGEVASGPEAATEPGMFTVLSPRSWWLIYGETGFTARGKLTYSF